MCLAPLAIECEAVRADEQQMQTTVRVLPTDVVQVVSGVAAVLEEHGQLSGGRPLVDDVRGHVAEEEVALVYP